MLFERFFLIFDVVLAFWANPFHRLECFPSFSFSVFGWIWFLSLLRLRKVSLLLFWRIVVLIFGVGGGGVWIAPGTILWLTDSWILTFPWFLSLVPGGR